MSGTSGAFTAAPAFADSAAFPAVTVGSDATSVTSPTGVSNWYNATTGFGTEFGSSRYQPYLLIGTAASQAPSTTTLNFAGDPPAGWGFALGDIDADWVFIQAYGDAARAIPLTVAELGFESAGNSCVGSPRPAACSAAGLPFESPVWVTATETFDGIVYQPPTLRGALSSADTTTLDTAGAYGWFRPTVPVRSIDLTFGPRAGFPTYSLTLAAPAPKTTITGTIGPASAGTAIAVAEPDGTPLLDLVGEPLTIPVAPDGSYSFEGEQRDAYLFDLLPAPGFVDSPPFLVAADSAVVVAPPLTLTPVTAPPTITPIAEDPVVEDPDLLAASGGAMPSFTLVIAAVMIIAGLFSMRTRRMSHDDAK